MLTEKGVVTIAKKKKIFFVNFETYSQIAVSKHISGLHVVPNVQDAFRQCIRRHAVFAITGSAQPCDLPESRRQPWRCRSRTAAWALLGRAALWGGAAAMLARGRGRPQGGLCQAACGTWLH